LRSRAKAWLFVDRLAARVDHLATDGPVFGPRRDQAPTHHHQPVLAALRIAHNGCNGLGRRDIIARRELWHGPTNGEDFGERLFVCLGKGKSSAHMFDYTLSAMVMQVLSGWLLVIGCWFVRYDSNLAQNRLKKLTTKNQKLITKNRLPSLT
jgi:hypothetical protein